MDRQSLMEQLKRHEGLRLYPYRDTLGYWTAGYGHLLSGIYNQCTIQEWIWEGITKTQAESWLLEDIYNAENLVRYRYLTPDQFDALSTVRQQVLVNMAFNLGGRLLKFRRFRAAILAGDWQKAHDEMLDSTWAKQVKGRAKELAEMMLHDKS